METRDNTSTGPPCCQHWKAEPGVASLGAGACSIGDDMTASMADECEGSVKRTAVSPLDAGQSYLHLLACTELVRDLGPCGFRYRMVAQDSMMKGINP